MKDSKMMKQSLDIGTVLSIPCSIYDGANSNEKFIECKIKLDNEKFTIEGAISNEYTDKEKGRVIAVLMDKISHYAFILFTGELFNQSNPV